MIENITMDKCDFNVCALESEYFRCGFEGCDFSGIDIYDTNFEECVFSRCNFSMSKFRSILRECSFKECKMMGADFTAINNFSNSLSFEKCQLPYCSFMGARLKGTKFRDCVLRESFFDHADFSNSVFDLCDLGGAAFFQTKLDKADLSTAHHFAIDPGVNRLRGALFSEHELRGLVSHLGIRFVEDEL